MFADDSAAGMAHDGTLGSFADLLEGARAGSEEAWRTLVPRYNGRMMHVICCCLGPHPALWRRLDPADIMQHVWESVFEALKAGATFLDELHFVAFLKTVTRHCAHLQLRLHVARKKSSMEREEPSSAGCNICSKQAGPAESAAASDLLETWLAGSASLDERGVLVWSLHGYKAQELADNMGMNVRTVRRIVQRARARWMTLSGGGSLAQPVEHGGGGKGVSVLCLSPRKSRHPCNTPVTQPIERPKAAWP